MPGYDRTGPVGQGPMTGRGMGPCGRTGNQQRPFGGRGMAFGRGFGRDCGYRFWQRPVELSKEEKVKILEAEKKDIEKALKELEE